MENAILIGEDSQQKGQKQRKSLLYLIGMILVLVGFFLPMGRLMDENYDIYIDGYALILNIPELGALFTLPIFISSVVGIISCFVGFPHIKLIRIILLIISMICTFITLCIVSFLTIMEFGVQVKGASFVVIFAGCVVSLFFFLKK